MDCRHVHVHVHAQIPTRTLAKGVDVLQSQFCLSVRVWHHEQTSQTTPGTQGRRVKGDELGSRGNNLMRTRKQKKLAFGEDGFGISGSTIESCIFTPATEVALVYLHAVPFSRSNVSGQIHTHLLYRHPAGRYIRTLVVPFY